MTQQHSTPPRGVYAAVLTPFGEDLEPNAEAYVAHCRWLLANGCDGLAPLGTTGEANSLSVAQRLGLIEAGAAAGLPMERCIIGTGSAALADAVTVTKAALEAGSTGALLLPPFYYKNPSEDGLFAFFSEVIQRVGDGRLRLYLYHFPQMSAVPVTPALIARLKAAYGDVIAGVKDSSGDWSYTATLLEEIPALRRLSRHRAIPARQSARRRRRLHLRQHQRHRADGAGGLPRLAAGQCRRAAGEPDRRAPCAAGFSFPGRPQGTGRAAHRRPALAQRHPAQLPALAGAARRVLRQAAAASRGCSRCCVRRGRAGLSPFPQLQVSRRARRAVSCGRKIIGRTVRGLICSNADTVGV